MEIRLDEKDLDFVIRTVVTKRSDYDNIKEIIRDKPDLINTMLDDPRLFQRIANEEEVFLKISPYLFFEILLRQAHRDLQTRTYTYEKIGLTTEIPVFDAQKVSGFLKDDGLRTYLAGMLSSFTKTQSTVIYFKIGKKYHKRKYSDLDVDDLKELSVLVEEEYKFPLYKRIADVCLFLTGIFPEAIEQGVRYPSSGRARPPAIAGKKRRSIDDYIQEGQEFYRLAAERSHSTSGWGAGVFNRLADNFEHVRKPLLYIAGRYLSFQKHRWFDY
ncbi:MAG: hypothetical protein AB1523_08330 [Bacillota bacterium]